MYVDSHAHLDFEVFDEDRELVIQHAIEKNISAIVTIGVDVPTSRKSVQLAHKYAPVYAAVGIHPSDCANTTAEDVAVIRELAGLERVVAIGEIGLDYHRMRAPKEKQLDIFKRHIALARELGLPVIVHNRDAHDDIYNTIVEEGATEVGGVLHSFTGNEDFLEKILLTNFYVSFTGAITFKKSEADALIRKTPLERLLLETDSPFLAPVPLRGKRNEPSFIIHTARKIASIKNIAVEKLAEVTTENARALFKIA